MNMLRGQDRPLWGVQPGKVVYPGADSGFIVGTIWDEQGPCLTDTRGRYARLRDHYRGPDTITPFDDSLNWGVWRLKHESDILAKNRVTSALIEFTRGHVCWDGENGSCAMILGPQGCYAFQSSSDTAALIFAAHREAMNRCYVGSDVLGLVRVSFPHATVLGLVNVWADERDTYQALVMPCPDEFRVEPIDGVNIGELWSMYSSSICDLMPQEAARGFVISLISDRADSDVQAVERDEFSHDHILDGVAA